MQAKLILNGTDISGYLAESGIAQSPIYRQESSIVTMDGIEHRSNIQKVQLDVEFARMRAENAYAIADLITQPSTVTYLDLDGTEKTKTFWVEGPEMTQERYESGITWVEGGSMTLVER